MTHSITLTAADLSNPLKERAIRYNLANKPCSDTYEYMAADAAARDHLLARGFYPRHDARDLAEFRPGWAWVTFSRELERTIYARIVELGDTVRVEMDAAIDCRSTL